MLLLAIATLSIYLNRDSLKASAVTALNERLNAKVSVGAIKIGMVPGRYGILLILNQVVAHETHKVHGSRLLQAEQIRVAFAILPVLTARYEITALTVKDARIYPAIDPNGMTNWDNFVKPDSGRQQGEALLRSITLENVLLHYANRQSGDTLSLSLMRFALQGKLTAADMQAKLKSEATLKYFKNEAVLLERERSLNLMTDLMHDGSAKIWKAENAQINLGRLNLSAIFEHQSGENATTKLQLSLSKSTNLAELVPLLPRPMAAGISEYQTSGNVTFNLKYEERVNSVKINGEFTLDNGRMEQKGWPEAISGISVKGSYWVQNEGKAIIQEINLPTISANWKGSTIMGSYRQRDADKKTKIEGMAKGVLPANVLNPWISGSGLQCEAGEIKFSLKAEGESEANVAKLSDKVIGNIELIDLAIKSDSLRCENISGNIALNQNVWNISNLSAKIGLSDFELNGMIKNDKSITANVNIRSNRLRFADIKSLFPASESNSNKRDISGNIDFELNQFEYEKINIQELKGSISIQPRILSLNIETAKCWDGRVWGSVMANDWNRDNVEIFSRFNSSDLNVKRIFDECDNFGQQELTAAHLEGRLTASADLSFSIKNQKPDFRSIKMSSEIEINNGRLMHFRPLQSLAKFINEDELNDIGFKTVKFTMGIADERIIIPQVSIRNSALDFTMSGQHGFDNTIQYAFEFRMADLVSARRRKLGEEQYYEQDGSGSIKLHVTMSGSVNNPVIKYDKKKALTALKEDLKSEKETLKETLRKEFGGKKEGTKKGKLNGDNWEDDIPD